MSPSAFIYACMNVFVCVCVRATKHIPLVFGPCTTTTPKPCKELGKAKLLQMVQDRCGWSPELRTLLQGRYYGLSFKLQGTSRKCAPRLRPNRCLTRGLRKALNPEHQTAINRMRNASDRTCSMIFCYLRVSQNIGLRLGLWHVVYVVYRKAPTSD